MASFAIGLIVARPTLSRLADERGRKLVMLIGLIAIALAPFGYLLMAILPHLVTARLTILGREMTIDISILAMMVIRAFHGLSIAAFVVAYSALVIDIAPPANRGELIGYMSLVNPSWHGHRACLGGLPLRSHGFLHGISGDGGFRALIGLVLILRLEEPYRPVPPLRSRMP
jgi:MFS family permease